MKKEFFEANINIVNFNVVDVIATSDDVLGDANADLNN